MTLEQMREYIRAFYNNSPAWSQRVAKMPDNQVYAVYMRITNKGSK